MKKLIAILLMSLFAAGCSLGVPIIDDQAAHENGNAGVDNDTDRGKPSGGKGQDGAAKG